RAEADRTEGGTDDHRRLRSMAANRAPSDSVAAVQREVASWRRCPRLVAWRGGGGRSRGGGGRRPGLLGSGRPKLRRSARVDGHRGPRAGGARGEPDGKDVH